MAEASSHTVPIESDDSHSANDKPTFRVVWVFLALLIAYPLSIGPVARFYHNRSPPRAVEVLYQPMQLLYRNNAAVRPVLDWYGDLWGIN